MLHEIVEYHYKNCTRKGLVLEKLKKEYYLLIGGAIIICIVFMASMIYVSKIIFLFIPCIFIFGLSLLGLVNWFNNRAKKFVKSKYGFDTDKSAWGGKEFTDYMDRQLINYLETHNMNTDDIMEELICESIKYSDKIRYKSFWETGFFVASILPIWIKYIDLVFHDITNSNEILFTVLVLFIMVLIVATLYSAIKNFFSEIADSILNKTSKKYISFADDLRNIRFQKRLIDNSAIEQL